MGTAGAIKNSEKYIDDTFVVLNGDSYSGINLTEFINFHTSKRSIATMGLTSSKESMHYGNVIVRENKIADFVEKTENKEGLVNSGIYVFEPWIFNRIEPNKNVSLEKEIFPMLAKEGNLYGYRFEGYFMDIGRPETYHKFKEDVLNTIILMENNSIRDAMKKISRNEIDLVLITDVEKRLKGVLNNRIIRNYIINGGNAEDNVERAMIKDPITAKATDDREKIVNMFITGTHRVPVLDESGRVVGVEFHVDEIKKENFQVLRGKSPLRISFAGGGTDLPHFFEKHGGMVINSTIDKYCHATIKKRADSRIIINSEDAEDMFSLEHVEYNKKFDLVKAIIKKIKPDFGFELYIHNDIPPGRGLGSSASFAVLLTKLLSQMQGKEYSDEEAAKIAYEAEKEELGIKGGWQDQYAAVTGGFSFMEFKKDGVIIYPLRLKESIVHELNSRLLLCYVGGSHFSGDIHSSQEEQFFESEEETTKRLNRLKEIAVEIKDSLLTKNIDAIGKLLHESWEMKKKFSDKISNFKINEMYDTGIKNGAVGGKLLGAGGGGYLLFFYSLKKRNQLVNALKKAGGEIMSFNFDSRGFYTWSAENP